MRFDCGESWGEKEKRLSEWHLWFAWYPVRIGTHDCRWLEHIERRGTYSCSWADCSWDWEYRAHG